MIFKLVQEIFSYLVIFLSWFIITSDLPNSFSYSAALLAVAIRLIHIRFGLLSTFISLILSFLMFSMWFSVHFAFFQVLLLLSIWFFTDKNIFKSYFMLFSVSLALVVTVLLFRNGDYGLKTYTYILLYIIISVPALFLLLLRQDIEYHHIIKHRLGKQSRVVTVPHMLSSKKILDPVLRVIILVSTFSVIVLTAFFTYASLPVFKDLHSHFNKIPEGEFPAVFNMNKLGKIKLSDKTYVIVETENNIEKPLYLKSKVLNGYQSGIWYPEKEETRNPLKCSDVAGNHMAVFKISLFGKNLKYGVSPFGTCEISGVKYEFKRSGVIKFVKPVSNPVYKVSVSDLSSEENFPEQYLFLPENLPESLEKFKFQGSYSDKFNAVKHYLSTLKYSDDYGKVHSGEDPVEKFLMKTKKGPCGLFAAAAVIMLRLNGIPARLVLGFSHGNKKKNKIIFKGFNAHSWVEVLDRNGYWSIFDPTENARTSVHPEVGKHEEKIAGILVFLGFVILLVSYLYVVFYMRKTDKKLEKSPITYKPAKKKISVSKYEASMLFNELIGFDIFANKPRKQGETALHYAMRLKDSGHEYAEILWEAAETANNVLFGDLNDKEKTEYIARLKEIYLSLEKK